MFMLASLFSIIFVLFDVGTCVDLSGLVSGH